MQPSLFTPRRFSHCCALASLVVCSSPAWSSGNPQEVRELTLALKQLETVQAIVKRAESQALSGNRDIRTTRYELDYDLVQADLARIADGVRSYLSPTRAQPRDLQDITGDYSRDRGTQ